MMWRDCRIMAKVMGLFVGDERIRDVLRRERESERKDNAEADGMYHRD